MKQFMQVFTDLLAVAVVILTQATLILALVFVVALVTIPQNSLVLETLKWLGGFK